MTTTTADTYPFLAGGAQMGKLTRNHDWAATPLGTPDQWPLSLRTMVGILLNAKFPMFLWWGHDLIQFYNDAYRPSLGETGKHPAALGQKGLDCWPEIWPAFKPLIDQIMSGGEAIWQEDQLVPIYRNGHLEDVYWTFGYSPVLDEAGQPAGVLVICTETTTAVLNRRRLEASEARFRTLLEQAPVAIGSLRGEDLIIETANQKVLDILHKPASIIGKPWFEALPELVGQPAETIIKDVYRTGVPFTVTEFPALLENKGHLQQGYYTFSYLPMTEQGAVTGILQVAVDVTEQILARQAIETSEAEVRRLTDTVPAIIWTTQPDGYCTYLNKQWYDFTGQTPLEAEGFGWLDATHPDDKEAAGQLFVEANAQQKPFSALYRLRQKGGQYRWCLDLGSPRFSSVGDYEGMVGTVIDVHDQKLAEEEKQKLAAIIEASHEFIGMAGLDSSVQYCNPAALSLLGWDRVDGKSILDCVYPPDRERAQSFIDELLEAGSVSHEIRFVNEQTGEPFWIQWNGVTLNDPVSNHVVAMATVSPIITERKRAEQALKESEERFQAAVVAVDGILWTNNALGQMEGEQPGWASLTGQTQDEYQGYGWAKAVHPDDAQPTVYAWNQAVAGRRMFVFEHRVRQHNGHWGLYSIRAIPLLDAAGAVREWVGVHTDITEPRRAAQALADSEARFRTLSGELDKKVQQRTRQLEESVSDLERSNQNLQQFAYVASHDLQEPLRKIQSFGDLLKNQYATELGDGVNYLGRMQAAASRMSTLIRDLLTYSRIATQQETTEPVSLTTVVDTALADLDVVIEETKAVVTIGSLPIVSGDSSQLVQLMQNLVSNALKFHRVDGFGGPIPPRIQISCQAVPDVKLPPSVKPTRQVPDYYRIDVSDNGIGFDEKYTDRIFQVFQRLHGRSEFAGTGIGLAICQKIVANHGGAITATSRPGEGSTFRIYLPR